MTKILFRMHQSNLKFVVILLMAGLVSCSNDIPMQETGPDVEIENIQVTGDENYANGDSDYIFDQDKLHTFELTIPVSSFNQINNDPAAEKYVEGSLTFEGETVSPVGIRYKGSIGAFANCLSGNNFLEPSGVKTCTKLSMKVKFNWEGADTKFYGLKKLQLHSMNQDPTQMRERLGYHLFNEMGVRAPRATHAKLIINGLYYGVYAIVEQIDGRFTKYHYEDGDGNIYKEVWPLNMEGKAYQESHYLEYLKTNEEDNPTAAMMKQFAEEIENASDQNLKSAIDKWMDIDEIISYAVVDRTIKVDDGAFHWYCFLGDCAPHNFYWYENPTEQTMHLIPWDMDNAFENIVYPNNGVIGIADDWGEISNNCNTFLNGWIGQWSAACDKLTGGWAEFDEEYKQLKKEFIEGPLSKEIVEPLIDKWAEQIMEATQEASELHDDALSVPKWEAAMSNLKYSLEIARQ